MKRADKASQSCLDIQAGWHCQAKSTASHQALVFKQHPSALAFGRFSVWASLGLLAKAGKTKPSQQQ
jgi:hypothetical protein